MKSYTGIERKALIADCKAEIKHLENCIEVYPDNRKLKSDLKRQQIALAALEADGQELARKVWSDLDRMASPEPFMREAYESVMRNYTSPVPVMKPVKLPDVINPNYINEYMSKTEVIAAIKEAGGEVEGEDNAATE